MVVLIFLLRQVLTFFYTRIGYNYNITFMTELLMETIYIDVLIILNIYVNFFLIRSAAKIMHAPVKNFRCILASVYGSLFSLLILVPEMGVLLNLFIKLAAAFTIVLAAFGFHSISRFIIGSITFFAVNFIFAGVIYAVYSLLKPSFISFGNTYFYVDFSLIILILMTAALYFAVCGIKFLSDKSHQDTGCYKVIIRCSGGVISMKGLADTGNSLVDFFSGKPVIICSKHAVGSVFDFEKKPPKGFRLLPYSTVSEHSLIPVFRPEEVIILDEISGKRKSVDAVIGLGKDCSEAIFNPKLLRL